jgi:hypothetical protein
VALICATVQVVGKFSMGARRQVFRRAACHDRKSVVIPRRGNVFEGIIIFCGTDAVENGDLLNVLLNTSMPIN